MTKRFSSGKAAMRYLTEGIDEPREPRELAPIEFTHNGFTYRTSGDASVVEGHDGKKWNQTHSLAIRSAALQAIEDQATSAPAKTSRQLDLEIAHALESPDPRRVAAYADKREAKRDRLEAASRKARLESHNRHGAARRILGGIPMGQPILVGHHSEKRHRRDLERADTNMRKAVEADNRAAELAGRAHSIGKGGISSDDPEAVIKLRKELAPLEKRQAGMKAANAAIRKHKKAGPAAQIAALVALGHGEKTAAKLLEKDFAGRIGFADYEINNNGANIRRIEKRIEELLAKEKTPAQGDVAGEIEGMPFTIKECKDLNRVQIVFQGKPSEAIRERLKSRGFRWAPTEGAWQRQASNGAWYHAKHALGVG